MEFLRAFARAQSRMKLYDSGHPARSEALAEAYEALRAALEDRQALTFTFLEEEVVLNGERVRGLGGWQPGREMAGVGVERLEIATGIDRAGFDRLAREVDRRLADPDAEHPRERTFEHGRIGMVAVGEGDRERETPELDEETEAVGWLQEQVATTGRVERAVARAVILSVSAAVRQSENLLDLLTPLRHQDEYSTIHSMNVSVLAVGLAESVGFGSEQVRSMGEAALLHDLGKQRVPSEILQKPASLDDEEWEIIQQHPEEGARLLLDSDDRLELAAVVAYEHHMQVDGGGYPDTRFPRRPHSVSQLIQICDVFDALRTRRPFRDPWPRDEIMEYLREGAGQRFDPQVVDAFIRLIERLDAERKEARHNGGGARTAEGTGAAGTTPGDREHQA